MFQVIVGIMVAFWSFRKRVYIVFAMREQREGVLDLRILLIWLGKFPVIRFMGRLFTEQEAKRGKNLSMKGWRVF